MEARWWRYGGCGESAGIDFEELRFSWREEEDGRSVVAEGAMIGN